MSMISQSGHMHPCLSNASRTALIPSACRMLLYNDLTSMVAMMMLGGNGVPRLKMVFKK